MSVFKDKFTNSWACKFRYRDFDGNTKQHKKTGFGTRKDASRYEAEARPRFERSCTESFSSVYEKYIQYCGLTLKVTTMRLKEVISRNHILPFFGEMDINAITKAKVAEWQAMMISSKNLRPSSLKIINNELAGFFNYCVRLDILARSPMINSMGTTKDIEKKFWTLDEFNSFIGHLDSPEDDMYRVLFNLLFYSGIRIGEALSLRYVDFDFESNRLHITKNLYRINGIDYEQTPKTKKSIRTIAMPKNIMNMVMDYYVKERKIKENDYLFPISASCVRGKLHRMNRRYGLKDICIHDLRHSHASLLMDMEIPIKQISERLGHENITTTLNIYAHLYQKQEDELSNKLDKLICEKTG